MRTTVMIDDDLLHEIRSLAACRRQTLGEILNQVIRRGLEGPPDLASDAGLPTFAPRPRARTILTTDILAAEDEE